MKPAPGAVAGVVFYYLFKSVDRYQVEILLSLALVVAAAACMSFD